MNKKPTFLKLAPSLPTSNSAERAVTGAASRLPLRAGLGDAPRSGAAGGGPAEARLSGSRGSAPEKPPRLRPQAQPCTGVTASHGTGPDLGCPYTKAVGTPPSRQAGGKLDPLADGPLSASRSEKGEAVCGSCCQGPGPERGGMAPG